MLYEKPRLEYWRKLRNLSRNELADKSGTSYSAIQKYELGQKNLRAASYQTVITIAEVLEIKPEELFEKSSQQG